MIAFSRVRSPWFRHPFFRWSAGIVGAVVAGVLLFEALHISVFTLIGMPHELCYVGNPKLIGLHVTSDVVIGLS